MQSSAVMLIFIFCGRKRTIHNKYGGVTAVDPIAEAEERKARIRNNCL